MNGFDATKKISKYQRKHGEERSIILVAADTKNDQYVK
jgi:hypothetical protein